MSQRAAALPDNARALPGHANSLADEHPEILAGAAFAGGFGLAMILKRLGR